MHPGQGNAYQREQHHEAARPDAGEITDRTENDRQNESAETTDHANHSADRTDMTGIINRNMLVNGGLA